MINAVPNAVQFVKSSKAVRFQIVTPAIPIPAEPPRIPQVQFPQKLSMQPPKSAAGSEKCSYENQKQPQKLPRHNPIVERTTPDSDGVRFHHRHPIACPFW